MFSGAGESVGQRIAPAPRREKTSSALKRRGEFIGANGAGDEDRVAQLLRALEEQEEEHQREIEELEKKRTDDLTALWDEHWRRVNEIEELRGDQNGYTEHLRETIREMEKENQELREKQERNSDLEVQIAELSAELDEKEEENSRLRDDVVRRTDRIRHLEGMLDDSGSPSLRDQLAGREKEVQLLRDTIAAASNDETAAVLRKLEKYEKNLVTAEQHIANLERENERLATERDALQSPASSAGRQGGGEDDARIVGLIQKVETYEKHLSEAEVHIRNLERENARLITRLEAGSPAPSDRSAARDVRAAEEKLKEAEARVQRLSRESRALQLEKEELAERLQVYGGEEREKEWQGQLQAAQREVQKLTDRLETQVLDSKNGSILIDTQKALIASKEKEAADLTGRVDELDDLLRRAEDVERLQQQLLKEKQEKNDNLIALVEEQRQQIAKLSEDDRWSQGRHKYASSRRDRNDDRMSMLSGYSDTHSRKDDRLPLRDTCDQMDTKGRQRSGSVHSMHSVHSMRTARTDRDRTHKAQAYLSSPSHVDDSRSLRSGTGYESDGRRSSAGAYNTRRDWNVVADRNHLPQPPGRDEREKQHRASKPASTVRPARVPATARRGSSDHFATRPPSSNASLRSSPSVSAAADPSRASDRSSSAALHPPHRATALRSQTSARESQRETRRVPAAGYTSSRPAAGSRLEQLKSQLQDARTERLRIQARKRGI